MRQYGVPSEVLTDNGTQFTGRFLRSTSTGASRPRAALRRAVNDLGFRALRIVPWLWGLPPNHRLYYPLLAQCVALGIRFMTQVGHAGPLRMSETGRPIPYLDDVALVFPELVVIGGQLAGRWPGAPLHRQPLRHKRPVMAATRIPIAAQLPTHRSRVPAQLLRDRPHRVAGPMPITDQDAFVLGQKSPRDLPFPYVDYRRIVQPPAATGGD